MSQLIKTLNFDAVVLGGGPAGERAAIQAARARKQVALVERAHVVGGARVNWGTIPSKTLRESALFVHGLTRNRLHGIKVEMPAEITVSDFMYRERLVVQRELELINNSLDRYRIDVYKGHGKLVEPHLVSVISPEGKELKRLRGQFIVIATGSTPNRPPGVPFDGETVFDSDTILKLPRLPRSMTILGAGVIGIEYASIFAALGIEVTLVDTRDRLLPYLDREIVWILEGELRRLGIIVMHGDRHEVIERRGNSVYCRTQKGAELVSDVLFYCVGRDGNTRDIGLETLGIETNKYGLIPVNENYQTVHPHVYAVGDVIGYPALASTSMEQGRRAMRHAFALPGATTSTDVLPFAIYAIPEVSYIGDTEEQLQEKGTAYVAGRGQFGMNPRGQIIGDTEGLLKLLFDAVSARLLGVHIVGSAASELIHIGQAYLQAGVTAFQIAESMYNYPTLSDLYRHAALSAATELKKRSGKEGSAPP